MQEIVSQGRGRGAEAGGGVLGGSCSGPRKCQNKSSRKHIKAFTIYKKVGSLLIWDHVSTAPLDVQLIQPFFF